MTGRRRLDHPAVRVAGYSIATRAGRVFLVDQEPERDPGLRPAEVLVLAAALQAAAGEAGRDREAGR